MNQEYTSDIINSDLSAAIIENCSVTIGLKGFNAADTHDYVSAFKLNKNEIETLKDSSHEKTH